MNRGEIKIVAIVIAATLAVWIGGALLIHYKTQRLEEAYRHKAALIARYEALAARWSQKSQKAAIQRVDRLLRLYRCHPTVTRRKSRKIYTFTLDRKRADKVLDKILGLNLAIDRLRLEKGDDTHLKVTMEVSS